MGWKKKNRKEKGNPGVSLLLTNSSYNRNLFSFMEKKLKWQKSEFFAWFCLFFFFYFILSMTMKQVTE